MTSITTSNVLLQVVLALTTAFIALVFQLRYTKQSIPPIHHPFASLDGLRGLLAFFVFQHHAFIWYFMAHHHRWALPPNLMIKNLGEVSVVLFFMITGFLFIHKINSAESELSWVSIFQSRIRRLVPLYFSVLTLLVFTVFTAKHWALVDTLNNVLTQLFHWVTFNVLAGHHQIDLNGFKNTHLILAGVTWTLAYEWWFYLSLPAIAFFMGKKTHPLWLMIGILGVLGLCVHALDHRRLFLVMAFLLGGIGSWLIRNQSFNRFCQTNVASILVMAGLVSVYGALKQVFSYQGVLAIAPLFWVLAGGCSMFKVMTHPTLKRLGDISYSLYLVHGIVLFIAFYFLMGIATLKTLNTLQYSLVIAGLSFTIALISTQTFQYIEQPFMRSRQK